MTTANPTPPTQAGATTAGPREMRRILASSFIGTAIEYYDFVLYATAASIVFDQVFFTGAGEGVALLLSFGTLAAGYLARPLGGLVFGHLGDRLGRKSTLIVTLVLMGVASVLIGLLPTPAQIGVAAPLLLVTLRVLQGVAVGGEWGGAMLLAFERAQKTKRGFAASFAYMGAPAGAIVATLVLSAASTLPHADFLAWGWRIPFLLSAVLVLVGLVIRLKVAESAVFTEAAGQAKAARAPVVEVVTKYWRSFLISVGTGIAGQAAQGLMGAWAISYAVRQAVLSPTSVLNVKALAGVCTIVMIIVAARLSDRIGRKRVMLGGMVGAAVLAFPILHLLESGQTWALFVALFLGLSVVQGFTAGPYGAFAAELYPTRIRYSGTSIGYQTASTLGAGFMPMLATGLVLAAGGSLWLVAVAWIALSAIGGIALLAAQEGKDKEIREIG
ncbi:MFS transporter [Nocardiopsis suaedae]|uniref:MFS transporter n=1 Tax=Nocardiopsis suaedae TaxID=3018444 RepID=A0ABT4TKC0_9ACTN|nr:MFS transporter [Nocardiopsis suaedae]MDA2805158.1 MFS transporter [Nocardiopsis suaedae]